MARPNFQEQKIEHGAEWEPLESVTGPVEPSRVSSVLSAAQNGEIGRLHRLYEHAAATDDRLGGVLSTLKRSVASRRVRISPSSLHQTESEKNTAKEYAEHARFLIQDLDMRTVLKRFVSPYLKGVDVYEIMYEKKDAPIFGSGRPYVPVEIEPVQPRRIREMQGYEHGPYGKVGIAQNDGEILPLTEYDDRKVFALYDEEGRSNFDKAGVGRRVLTWWIIKQFVMRWWGEYADVYGEPIRIANVDDPNNEERNRLESALRSLGKNGYALIPDDVALEIKDMAMNGTGHDIYDTLISAANTAFTVSVLGQTDTTEGGEGAYAKAKVQDRVRHDILEDVSGLAEDGLEKTAESALRINYAGRYKPHLAPSVEIPVPSAADVKAKAKAFNILQKKVGVPISVRELRDEFGLDTPHDGEPVLVNGKRYENLQEYLDSLEEEESEPDEPMNDDSGFENGEREEEGDNQSPNPDDDAEEELSDIEILKQVKV